MRPLLARIVDEYLQPSPVGLRIGSSELIWRYGFAHQAVTPGFDHGELGAHRFRPVRPTVDRCFYRGDVHVAHELTDELHLPAATLMRTDAARCYDGIEQAFRKVELAQVTRIQRNQRFAQVLQRVHRMFALRF